jgi:hypothetical protein
MMPPSSDINSPKMEKSLEPNILPLLREILMLASDPPKKDKQ